MRHEKRAEELLELADECVRIAAIVPTEGSKAAYFKMAELYRALAAESRVPVCRWRKAASVESRKALGPRNWVDIIRHAE